MNPISVYLYLLRQIWTYLGEKKLHFIIAYVTFIVANSARLFEPFVLGLAVNELQKGGENVFNNFLHYIIILGILRGIFIVLHHFVGRIWDSVAALEAFKNYTTGFYEMVMKMPLERNENHHSGKIIEQIRKGAESLNDFGGRNFLLIEIMVEFTFSMIFVIAIFGKLGLAVLLSGIITLVISVLFDKILVKYYKWDAKNYYQINSLLFDYISNIFTTVTLRLEKVTQKNIKNKIEEKQEKMKKLFWGRELKRGLGMNIFPSYIKYLILLGFVYFSLQSTGAVLIGSFTMLIGYLDQVQKGFSKFNNLYGTFVIHKANLELSDGIKEDYKEFIGGKNNIIKNNENNIDRSFNTLEIKNLNYKYPDNTGGVENINLDFKKGQKIAFIGESGSGKTTTMKILRGICGYNSGKLFLDSKQADFDNIFALTTLIPQEPEIFESSLEHNITFGIRTNNYKKDVENSLKIAAFDRVVNRLEKGLESKINEKGVNLSGGEKQRLAFARGVYFAKNSEIILLDEPTSSVDSYNENKIYDRIFEKFSDKIIISSVHKLNLLEKFDYIYKFENGKIVDKGTFEEMKNKI
ncbi:MAG: ABC transporter ATP-binding protein/permease [Candidatus Gracilibacteria bacterium]|nr:ABC transporter ATP-binding protein/permease [Candidatus Gracilibacteria bacterium]